MTETNEIVKEISLDEPPPQKEIKEEVQKEIQNKESPQTDFVEAKLISELSDTERAIIIKNAKEGIDQPNYTVKFFKNGNCRIKKKKEETPTVSQKVIKQQLPARDSKVFYSDNQLLFEHIIELNSKLERLTAKQKKLKNRVKDIRNDMYVEENDFDEPQEQYQEDPTPSPQPPSLPPQQKLSWRNRVKYL